MSELRSLVQGHGLIVGLAGMVLSLCSVMSLAADATFQLQLKVSSAAGVRMQGDHLQLMGTEARTPKILRVQPNFSDLAITGDRGSSIQPEGETQTLRAIYE